MHSIRRMSCRKGIKLLFHALFSHLGPSIYDVHTGRGDAGIQKEDEVRGRLHELFTVESVDHYQMWTRGEGVQKPETFEDVI